MNGNNITYVGSPLAETDVVKKMYVDEELDSIQNKLSAIPDVFRRDLETTFASPHVVLILLIIVF